MCHIFYLSRLEGVGPIKVIVEGARILKYRDKLFLAERRKLVGS